MESCLIMETVDLLFSKGQIMSMFINIEKDVLKQYLDAGFSCSYHHFICPRNTRHKNKTCCTKYAYTQMGH